MGYVEGYVEVYGKGVGCLVYGGGEGVGFMEGWDG